MPFWRFLCVFLVYVICVLNRIESLTFGNTESESSRDGIYFDDLDEEVRRSSYIHQSQINPIFKKNKEQIIQDVNDDSKAEVLTKI